MPGTSSYASVEMDVASETEPWPERTAAETPFRILLLGDFSGRAGRGDLSGRRPIEIDRDNFEEVLARLSPEFRAQSSGFSLHFKELDDFHPDRIYGTSPLFESFRQARLAPPPARPSAPPRPILPGGGNLLDSVLDGMESPSAPPRRADELQDFVERAVAGSLVPRPDQHVAEFLAGLDEAASELMRAILHHKRFQALEAAWRGVFFLVRARETGPELKLYLLDVAKEELAEDQGISHLRRLLVDDAVKTPGAEPWAVVAANFSFSRTDADIRTLSRLAKIMQSAGAPFLAEADPPGDAGSPEIARAWDSLRRSPEASWLGLAFPRFLLRLPYGRAASPVESFAFEEMPGVPNHRDYLWGNPSFACACLLGRSFSRSGWSFRPGVELEIRGLPLHLYEEDGEKRLKPCAELLMTDDDAEDILDQGIMPLVSVKNQDVVRLLRFQSIASPPAPLSGRWA